MSVEFQLGHNDHHKVEDWLARDHDGAGAISLHVKSLEHQASVAHTARTSGLEVLVDPRTDRLAHEGFGLESIPGYRESGVSLAELAADIDARALLVKSVLDVQRQYATIVTPPYFFGDEKVARLNLALAEQAIQESDLPVRPIVPLKSRTSQAFLRELSDEYARAGITSIDLRFSPLGGEADSIAKIRFVFAAADLFMSNGIDVTLGHSGNIGQVAFALGHVTGYSVGIGNLERVDLAGDYTRQATPPRLDENGRRIGGGLWEGVYLPGLAITVSKKRAEALLAHSDIRTKIGRCRIGGCANSLMGPTSDHRTHYLHSRAAEMAFLQNTPEKWRAEAETKRLRRALELRQLVNAEYRARGELELKTRTLESLVDGIAEHTRAAA